MLPGPGAYLRLMRPANCLIGFFSVLGASIFAGQALTFGLPVFLGALATAFIMGGGNALNDYFDAEIDRWNRPDRPLPSGLIARKRALIFSAVLFLAGGLLSLLLPAGATFIAIVNIGLLIVYARYSKKMLLASNVLIAGMTASVFIFGGAILGRIGFNVLVLASSAFWVMLAREILKDIEDREGDRRAGARTLPLRWGSARARIVSTVLLGPAILSVYGPEAARSPDRPALALIVPATLCLGLSAFLPPAPAQRIIKLATVLVLLAFLAGSL